MIYRFFPNEYKRYMQNVNNSFNEKILDFIIDDDDENFSQLILPLISVKSDTNIRFSLTSYRVPKLISNWPTYGSLCAFFSSEKCFNSLILLCPEGIQSEIFKEEDDYGRSILHFACFSGNLNIIRKLCQAGYDLHVTDKNGYQVSHYAAMNGQIDVLKYLLIKGIEIVWSNENMMSPLHLACYYGQLDTIKFICEDVDTEKASLVNSFESKTALHFACDGGFIHVVNYLLNSYKNIVEKQINKFDYNSFTPILYACKNGSLDCVKSLVNFGNVRFNYGNRTYNPFVEAASRGHIDIIKYFINLKEVDLNASDSKGTRALKAAVDHGHFDIIELLINNDVIDVNDKNKIGDLFMIACENSDIETMQFLDNLLNIPYEKMGSLYMTKAIVRENEEIVSFLISKNCEIKKSLPFINFRGKWTPFMSFLKSKGASFTNVILKSGIPLIVEAAKHVNLKNLKKLISEGFELNKEIIEKYKLLSITARAANIDSFLYLMSYKPDLNDGENCFLVLLEKYNNSQLLHNQRFINNCMSIAEILLSKYNVNPNDQSILNYAFSHSLISILELLLRFNANFENHPFDFKILQNDVDFNVVNYLKNKNVNINNLISNRNVPIIVEALRTNNLIIINRFIDNGFELNRKIISKYKIFENACLEGNIDMFNFLIQYEPVIKNESKVLFQLISEYKSCKNKQKYFFYFNENDHKQNATDINNYFVIIEELMKNYQIIPDEKIINHSAINELVEILELLANHGADFSNCGLDYSKMIYKRHLPIYKFLEKQGCKFNKYQKYSYDSNGNMTKCEDSTCSPIEINFKKTKKIAHDIETLLFLIDYSSKEQIINLRVENKSFFSLKHYDFASTVDSLNIIDVLLLRKRYHEILTVFKKINQVLLPQICTIQTLKKKLTEKLSEQDRKELDSFQINE